MRMQPYRLRLVSNVWRCSASSPALVSLPQPLSDREAKPRRLVSASSPLLVTFLHSCRLRLVRLVICAMCSSPELVTHGLHASSPRVRVCRCRPLREMMSRSRLRMFSQLVRCSTLRLGKRWTSVRESIVFGERDSRSWSTTLCQCRQTRRRCLTSFSPNLDKRLARMAAVRLPQLVALSTTWSLVEAATSELTSSSQSSCTTTLGAARRDAVRVARLPRDAECGAVNDANLDEEEPCRDGPIAAD